MEHTIKLDTNLWTKNFILVLITNMCFYASSYLIVSTISRHLMSIDAPQIYISMSVSMVAGGAFVMRNISGNAMDIFGRRNIAILGAITLWICYILYVVVGLNGMVIVRTINGLAWGVAGTAIATICTDVTPKHLRAEGLGFFAISTVICTSFAPMIGIVTYNTLGYMAVVALAVFIHTIGVISLVSIKMPQVELRKEQKLINPKNFVEKKALLPSSLNVFISICITALNSYIIIHGETLGLSSIWVYFVGHLIFVMIARSLVHTLVERKGMFFSLVLGFVLMSIGMAFLWLAQGLLFIILGSMVFGTGYGFTYPTLQGWTIDRSPEDKRGVANGCFLAGMDLAGVGAGFVFTPIVKMYSTSEIYLTASIAFVIPIIMLMVLRKAITEETSVSRFRRDFERIKNMKKS